MQGSHDYRIYVRTKSIKSKYLRIIIFASPYSNNISGVLVATLTKAHIDYSPPVINI